MECVKEGKKNEFIRKREKKDIFEDGGELKRRDKMLINVY
jgi:hypothetical protein